MICVDNLETGTLENLEHLMVDEPVDVVYHLAALASPIDLMSGL